MTLLGWRWPAREYGRAGGAARGTTQMVGRHLPRLAAPHAARPVVSDAYLATLLRVLPDPVISVDDEGRVLTWNAAAATVLGRPAAEAIGHALAPLVSPDDPAPLEALLRQGLAATASGEIRFRRAAGDVGIAQVSVSLVYEPRGEVRAVVLRDITEMRRDQERLERQAAQMEAQTAALESLNQQLQHQASALEAALAARSRFYAAMSHELRTPINAVLGYAQLLLEGIYGELTPAQTVTLERAQRAARHLQELVSDVLDLARIEAGRFDLRYEWVNVAMLIEELLDTIRPVAVEHGTPLEHDMPAARPTAFTDPRRVRQILLNLLSNAIKYGEQKAVRITCGPTAAGGVYIDVIDHGPGIAPADLDRIFQEFVRLDSTVTGTGLGLSISRALAHALGGTLEATSAPGVGSTFRLILPPVAERARTSLPRAA